jgi:hypothetical protein
MSSSGSEPGSAVQVSSSQATSRGVLHDPGRARRGKQTCQHDWAPRCFDMPVLNDCPLLGRGHRAYACRDDLCHRMEYADAIKTGQGERVNGHYMLPSVQEPRAKVRGEQQAAMCARVSDGNTGRPFHCILIPRQTLQNRRRHAGDVIPAPGREQKASLVNKNQKAGRRSTVLEQRVSE